MRSLLVAFGFLCCGVPALATPAPVAEAPTPPYAQAHRATSTASLAAQASFDDGLTLLYAFNPASARASFERATNADPSFALAWWGIAMSHGTNINTPYDAAEQRLGASAIGHALALDRDTPAAERALIAAAARRFAYAAPRDADLSARAYRDAMLSAARAFPLDDDLCALAAEAELDVHPWAFFNPDGSPVPGTPAAIAELDAVLARSPQHLLANHLLVHAWEESPQPQRALGAARRLAALEFEPAAEHLAHMPAHAFMRVGDYHAAGAANARAVALYGAYLASEPAAPATYLAHDCAFGLDAFMMSGESAAASRLAAACTQHAYAANARIALRSRDWVALAQARDGDDFTQGMLAVHAGRNAEARTLEGRLHGLSGDVASIEADVLAASLARATHDGAGEIAHLERAVRTQDSTGYGEPPAFYYPVRETLGAALYRAARYVDAERTLRDELTHDPENPRALFALAATLDRAGRTAEESDVRQRFTRAWAKADAPLDMNDY